MKIFDFRGLRCPVPVLKAYKIIKESKKNNIFLFLTDDKSAPKDFKDFCNNSGHELIKITKEIDHSKIEIKKISFEK